MVRRITFGAAAVVGLIGLHVLFLAPLLGVGDLLFAAGGEEITHPELDAEELGTECQVCHAEHTPDVVDDWYAGPHGKFIVKCFVCHGSLEGNFEAVPTTDRCISCHSVQSHSMDTEFMQGKNCFTCHPNHLLKPHLAVVE